MHLTSWLAPAAGAFALASYLTPCQAFWVSGVGSTAAAASGSASRRRNSCGLPSSGSSSSSRLAMSSETTYILDDKVIDNPFKPVNNVILVKVNQDASAFSKGGLALPNQSEDKPKEGTVVAAGPGRIHPFTGKLIPMCVQPGDNVLYSQFIGTKADYQGEEHMIITDDDLLLVYEGDRVSQESLKMVRDQVLVKLDGGTGMTDKGIALATAAVAEENASQGVVVALGEGRTTSKGTLAPTPMEVGDYVKYRSFASMDINIESSRYSVVRMVDCLCKWKP